jgi:hypothetical protein
MCSAKTIAGFFRLALEARKFSEDTNNPVKKRDFKEVERKWLSLARDCKCDGEKSAKRITHSPRRKRR